ncbi:hypothetical protein PILCRDRAFT_821405 [Piloderma croceum F 1598]|uniref:Uncharacterized protein n=1 Tax=Piloderma croceum (strain F 1598) TaxID=765440 RepID=A0A0C3BWB8_PILCF|nr:hypothetical protein PILCRDRAFT_821405 [Piloderma croceum F 1598]
MYLVTGLANLRRALVYSCSCSISGAGGWLISDLKHGKAFGVFDKCLDARFFVPYITNKRDRLQARCVINNSIGSGASSIGHAQSCKRRASIGQDQY